MKNIQATFIGLLGSLWDSQLITNPDKFGKIAIKWIPTFVHFKSHYSDKPDLPVPSHFLSIYSVGETLEISDTGFLRARSPFLSHSHLCWSTETKALIPTQENHPRSSSFLYPPSEERGISPYARSSAPVPWIIKTAICMLFVNTVLSVISAMKHFCFFPVIAVRSKYLSIMCRWQL